MTSRRLIALLLSISLITAVALTRREAPLSPPETPRVSVAVLDSNVRATPPVPPHAAPALGVEDLGDEAGGESSLSVDPTTGLATLWEQDASIPGLPRLRRARTFGARSIGLFGRGWRSELEASLQRDGEAFVAVGIEGLTRLLPAAPGTWVSDRGEVQTLSVTASGFELDDPAGRLLRFDPSGRLVAIEGELQLERAPKALLVVGSAGAVRLELDRGRVVRANGPGIDVRYEYAGDELARVSGTAQRTYSPLGPDETITGASGYLVRGAAGDLLRLDLGPTAQLAYVHVPQRTGGMGSLERMYTFERGRAEMSSDQWGGVWRYEADPDGWRIVSPRGTERARLDARGRVVGLSTGGGPMHALPHREGRASTSAALPPPATPTTSVVRERDGVGRVVVETGRAGRTAFERDSQGRVVRRTDGAGRTVALERRGPQLLITGDQGSSIWFDRIPEGRPRSVLTDDGGECFFWDKDGRLGLEVTGEAYLPRTWSSPREVLKTPWGDFTRERDGAGRVVSLTSPAGTFRWEYDATGWVRRVEAPNGAVTEIERDGAGRETTRRTTVGRDRKPVLDLVLARDATGLVTSMRRDGALIELERDASGRLTRASGSGLDLTYRWSDAGERLGTSRLERDGAGRLVRQAHEAGETRYGWDDLGRLAQVEQRSTVGTSKLVRHAYNGLGQVKSRAPTARSYYTEGQLLAEVTGNLEPAVRLWIHAPGLDSPLAYGDGKDWTFVHCDHLGTALAYTNSEGERVARAVLGPFGETIVAPAGGEPILFAGRPVDPETGLVHFRSRWYSPELGRYLEPHPLGPAAEDPWQYAGGDPLQRRDPLGLAPMDPTDDPVPTVWDRGASVATTEVDLARRLYACGDVAVAEAIANEPGAHLEMQLLLARLGLLDPPGRDRPDFSAWAARYPGR